MTTATEANAMRLGRRRLLPSPGAVLAGAVVLGCLASAGQLLFRAKPWWAVLMESTVPLVSQALFLLVTLDWALRARTHRWPRWTLIALAALSSTIAAAVVDWAASYTVRAAMGMTYGFGGDYLSRWWTESPSLLVVGGLGAFGAASAADAMQRSAALQDLQIDRARLARRGMEAQLAAMQARVNPRFLFETLSEIEVLCERDPAAGTAMLDALTTYLRTALSVTRDSSSTLGAELELVRAWLDIMNARRNGRLTYVIAAGDTPSGARVPPMLVLPLVQHAVESGGDGRRAILVSSEQHDELLRIVVIGPDAAFAAVSAPDIEAVAERLDALYGRAGRLDLRALPHDRSEAVLDIPLEVAPGATS